MVWYAKVRKGEAQEVKKKLLEQGVLDPSYHVKREGNSIYFPVKKKSVGFPVVDMSAKKRKEKRMSLKEVLSGVLSDEEMGELVKSFDIIGEIAVIDVPPPLEKKKRLIGKALMGTHKNVKTVFRKKSGRTGIYRTIPLELIAGEENYETVYTEHGIRMKLDVAKVYFSIRLSEERRRIASLVKEGEIIAGLFAGVGPFPLVIAKQKPCVVYAVELNPIAVVYMKKNIGMNLRHLKGKIIPIEGDVNKVVEELPKCDRILMPLPKGGEDFLDSVLKTCKDGGTVHFYQFAKDKDLYTDALKKIMEAGKRTGKEIRVVNKKVVRPYAPRVSQVVIDFQVVKTKAFK